MATVLIGPGDDVEAWCTRCRMNLEHRVIATVGRDIKRVHCLTCGGDHKYYPPKYQKTAKRGTRTAKAVSPAKAAQAAERSAARAEGEWTTIMSDLSADDTPRTYRVSESYGASEFIEHPVFGKGRVTDVLGAQRIQVIFKDGRKVLVCNRN
jgi:hypothetical protein